MVISKKASLAFALIFALLIAGSVVADDYLHEIKQTVNFSPDQFKIDEINGYQIIRMDNHEYLNDPGKPMLPSYRINVALPDGMTAESIEMTILSSSDYLSDITIFPSQPPIRISQSDDEIIFVEPDKDIYQSDSAYPAKIAKLIRQSDLAGQSFAEIEIYPLQYLPTENKIILHSTIEIKINGNSGYVCGDYLPANITEENRAKYLKRLESQLVNRDDIRLSDAGSALKSSSYLPSGTPFEHVIITTQYFETSYQPLVEWRNLTGMRDTLITTEFIYANYDGVSEKEKIRNFIIDAHQNWGTLYFLMGGELTVVPFEYRVYNGESIPSDNYYADYDDDWEWEVYVGRNTADDFDQIARFVNKVIKYESDPPMLGYLTNVAMVGMDLTLLNQAPYYTLTRTEWLKDSIHQAYLPENLVVTTVYDTHAGSHRDAFLAAINNGQNLINHSDHSNQSVMGCGSLNHGWHISSYDVPYLTNYHKYCNIVSLGCLANRMDYDDAISEHFLFRTDSTGAVSFTGNTRSGWFYVGDPFSLSSSLDMQWWVGLFQEELYRLGEPLAYAKSAVNTETTWPYSEWTFSLLGDPGMTIWTWVPTYLYTDHISEIEALSQTFEVSVSIFGGVPVADAKVTLWKGDEVYAVGYSGPDGMAYIDIDPQTRGEMKPTITKHNFVPLLSSVQIIGNEPPQCLIPGDTTIFSCELGEVSIPVGCFDSDGNLAEGPELVRGPGEIVNNLWYYTPLAEETIEVTIICTDSLGYSCESTFFVTFEINDLPLLTLPADTALLELRPATELVYPITMLDDNATDCIIMSGPGILVDNDWRYTPIDDEQISVTIRLNDDCGEYDEKTFNLDYQIYYCGDANDNGETNILDITYLVDFLYSGGEAPNPENAGDANGDDNLNILDITYLIAYLYQFGPAAVCP